MQTRRSGCTSGLQRAVYGILIPMATLREQILRHVGRADDWIALSLRDIEILFGCTRSHAYQIRRKLISSGLVELDQPRDPLTGSTAAARLRITDAGQVALAALDILSESFEDPG